MSKFGEPIKGFKGHKKLSKKARLEKLYKRLRNFDFKDLWDATAILKAIAKLEMNGGK